jgi:hypothetical protein
MIVGKDGIVIAADLHSGIQDETIGALTSAIASSVGKSLEKIKLSPFKQVTVEASQGKIFLTDVEIGTLVVTTESQVNLGLVRLEIKSASNRLKNR